ncbi:type IVB secretion system protein IcmH/DotU [Pseudomonas eucalypticola]|uniref:DotU family type IV/VI secretion system protein n=1 Tax=Pseudomonas eucalypticola TaxID=2599595 RepID=A0A7D5H2T9_9PSED|nr:type IVB secretion system protein IcmH/DotU [Pseudomonas eucalypticola]QKZ02389.1 DotU family type IV/VI secretion system protein [Pseudomonas eucalypticola]
MTDAVMQDAAVTGKTTLKEMVNDFISMALLIRRGRQVTSTEAFDASVDEFLTAFERQALAAGYSAQQVHDTQYALCAFLDESVMRASAGDTPLRTRFELNPLQLRKFGIHLAGEGFFDKIDALRADVKANVDVLEVYHLCLALGFQGKYTLDDKDRLRYLANTLGQDIARYRKPPTLLSPDWALPDQVSQMLRYEIPAWVYVALVAVVCASVYMTLDWLLGKDVAALSEHISKLFSA